MPDFEGIFSGAQEGKDRQLGREYPVWDVHLTARGRLATFGAHGSVFGFAPACAGEG